MFDLNNLTDLNGDGVIDQLDADIAEMIGDVNGDGIIDQQDLELAGIDLSDIALAFNAEAGDLFETSTGIDSEAVFEPSFGGISSTLTDIAQQIARHPHIVTDAVRTVGDKIGDVFGGNTGIENDVASELSASIPQNISFGASSLSPREWQDGAAYKDITPEVMDAIAEQIMGLFGEYGVDTYAVNGFENASMTLGGYPEFAYDPNLMWTVGQRYGSDAITGITAHEIGHHIVETKLADDMNVTDWQHELCSDYISGIVSEFHGVDHEVMHNLFADTGFSPASDTHPSGGLRSQAYDMGVEWAQNQSNSVFRDFLLTNESQLESMFQSVLDIFPGSYNEYVDW